MADLSPLLKLLQKQQEQETTIPFAPDQVTEQKASAVVNSEQDVEVTPQQEVSTEMANQEAKNPNYKTKEELIEDSLSTGMAAPEVESDPIKQKLDDTSKKYEELMNKETQKRDWRQNLPDLLAAAHNIINYGQGNRLPQLKTDFTARELAQEETMKQSGLDRLSKLQEMYRRQMADKERASYRQAQLDEAEKNRQLKKELAEAKPKEMPFAEKEQAKADIKEKIELKKENRKVKKEAEDSIKSIDEQIKNVKKARKLLTKSGKNLVADTGPIDQFIAKGTDEGQKLEQALNAVSLDKMVKMFSGMSKAIDSDAERAFFQSAQPSMGKYPVVNKEILDDMIINLESLKDKNKSLMDSIDQKGNRSEQSAPEQKKEKRDYSDNEVRRRTKDGKVAIFDKNTKEFLRYE